MKPIDLHCDKSDEVKIIQIFTVIEPEGVLKKRTSIFGLGDDSCVYYWNYENSIWKHYSATCWVETDGKKVDKGVM